MAKAISKGVRFRAELELNGKTATGIAVPAEIMERLGGKRLAVRAYLGAYKYRTTVAPMGGRFLMPVSAEHREKAGIAVGDEIDVELEVDDSPREVAVPPDLAQALGKNGKAKVFFDGLTSSQRQWFVTQVTSAKKAETRQRRVEEAVAMLRDGRKR